MRSTLILAIIALTVLVHAEASTDYGCNSFKSCSDCVGNQNGNGDSCGWCSTWGHCTEGNKNYPYFVSFNPCEQWHFDSCAGVTPQQTKCVGAPISPQRVRQLMGGKNSVNLTTTAKWTVQSRNCGDERSDWKITDSNIPLTTINLLEDNGKVYLNVETGICNTPWCNPRDYGIPKLNSHFIGLQSSQVGQTSLEFNQYHLPLYSCDSNSMCAAFPWKGPCGSDQFLFTAELTDDCLHIASKYTPSTYNTPVDYLDLLLNF